MLRNMPGPKIVCRIIKPACHVVKACFQKKLKQANVKDNTLY